MIAISLTALLLAAPALLALLVTAIDAFTWSRGTRGTRLAGRISLLIPARDEERTIGAALAAALAEPFDEILVYDDQSTDATAAIVDAIAASDPRVRRIAGVPLPVGWVGKVHACANLAQHATGDWLLYTDADVRLQPGALERLGSIVRARGADVVTAVPRQEVVTWLERAIVPLLHLIYMSWLPAALVWACGDPRMLMASGQLFAIERTALARVGGWAAVKREVVDDMAMGRACKRAGLRVVFADGHELARCRMYRSASEVWAGFRKNMYEGLGERPSALMGAIALHLCAFVAPSIAVLACAVTGNREVVWGAALGVSANLLQRSWLCVRHRLPIEGIVLQPLGVLALVALAIESWRRSTRGGNTWRGRLYSARSTRGV